jgi:hypothetical protein
VITMETPSLINPQQGKEQSHSGAYPAGEDYITREGRKLVLLPKRPLWRCRPFTPPLAGGRCGECLWR